MKGYYAGSKPKLYCEVRDANGALADPTSVTCAIYDDTGKLVSATATCATTKEGTGIYYYNGWTIVAGTHKEGNYKCIFTVTDTPSSNITRDRECAVDFEVLHI